MREHVETVKYELFTPRLHFTTNLEIYLMFTYRIYRMTYNDVEKHEIWQKSDEKPPTNPGFGTFLLFSGK
jgi:hypothetical protein